jgi:hypothetical protein
MITDPPREGYVPGLGCTCLRCSEPLIEIEIPTAEVQASRRLAYEQKRRGTYVELGKAETVGRAPGANDRDQTGESL